ncbi:MAG: SGNH/GDSL hydrolase family protein [Fusicatenibacter sp.]
MSLVWNCLGDSITDEIFVDRHYYDYIMERCPGLVVRNYGISGTRISENDETAFCRRYREMDQADVITVFGGVNDWGQQNPAPLGRFEDRDSRTFYGALHLLCEGLQTNYPEAVILFLTPIGNVGYGQFAIGKNILGYTVEDYADAICRVCASYKIPVLDLCRECGFTPENPVQNKRYFIDGLHLSEEGHKRISYPIEAMLKKYCGSDFVKRCSL